MFDWLGAILNPTGTKPLEGKGSDATETTPQESVSLGSFSDVEDVQETLSDLLVREMGKYRGGSGYPDLTLWVDDPIAAVLAAPLQERLKKDLLHSGCQPRNPRNCVTVLEGTPAEGAVAIGLSKRGKLNPGKVFVTFQETRAVSEKAVVRVYWGKGSLMDGSYEVDPTTRTRWRIGRGQTSNRQDYSFRTNEIVIRTDDPDEEIQTLNNHVSSAHADLVYREGRYYLQVLPSGSITGNNSTRIIRDQRPIPVEQPGIDYPLLDGDLIELGGTVLLEFKSLS